MSGTILSTNRLVLRYPVENDREFMVALWTDADMTRYTGGPRERAFLETEFENALSPEKREEYDLWMVEGKKEGALIGSAGFIPKEVDGEAFIELNYYIAKPYWGLGYAKEIATGLIEYGFLVKRLRTMIAIIDPDNIASIRVAEGVGMKRWKAARRSDLDKLIYLIERPADSIA